MNLKNQKQRGNIAIIALLILAAVVAGLVVYQLFLKPKKAVKTVTMSKQVVVKRSKTPGVIQRGLTGKAIDVNTGKIVTAARVFSPDDKTVYLQLDLQSPPKGTVIDYIRYKDGKYVDHGEVTLDKTDTNYILFNWTISKLIAGARDGNWKVATYTNGILEKRIAYSIEKSKVTGQSEEETVSANDSDYRLSKTLAALPQGN